MLWNTGALNRDQWKTPSEISLYLMQAVKELNAMAELNLMLQKHQQSVTSSPKRIQDYTLDAVDPTSKMHAQNTQSNLTTDPRAHCL